MREIKFRAWDKEINKMMYPMFGFTEKEVLILASLGVVSKNRDKFELLQYTGLKDKNGKEIYEGDICKGYGFPDEPNEYHTESQIGICKFKAGQFVIENINTKTIRGGEVNLQYKIEVIGNIYENPDLLIQK